MSIDPPRSLQQRKDDTLAMLDKESDAWVATANEDGTPYLVPLTFVWWQGKIIVSTPVSNPTARNLVRIGRTRLAIGRTRDVVLIDGTVRHYSVDDLPQEMGDAFAEAAWDARLEKNPFAFFEVTPMDIQVWREVNEIPGRFVMRTGKWLV